MEQQMDNLVNDLKTLTEGLEDLSNLMADEDRGSSYIKRLALEAEKLWVDALKLHNK